MPQSYSYSNTKVPQFAGWAPGQPPLESQPRGIGYDAGTHFVHCYQESTGLWTVSPYLTATVKADGTYEDWLQREFGATEIVQQATPPGHVVEWVWRPGLSLIDEVRQALSTTASEQRRAEQSLHLLLERLTELLLFVEPDGHGLDAFGLKSRELLILAATDVEDMWARYLRKAGFAEDARGYNTNQYVRLLAPLHLADYQFTMTPYPSVPSCRPFLGWDAARPTQSLYWYAAYNQTKHNKSDSLSAATLHRCIEAVMASVAMYCVRFSPYPLFQSATPVSSLVQHLLSVELVEPAQTSFYVPMVGAMPAIPQTIVCGNLAAHHEPWETTPLSASI